MKDILQKIFNCVSNFKISIVLVVELLKYTAASPLLLVDTCLEMLMEE